MRIQEIKPNPNNPRIIKDDKFKKLVKSIQDFPQMLELRPIVIDENNIVLGGNMRLKACIEAGLTDVPVKQAADLTEEQKKAEQEARLKAFQDEYRKLVEKYQIDLQATVTPIIRFVDIKK